jgi:hypothetical protein
MSKIVALQLAVQLYAGAPPATSIVLDAAQKFAEFISEETPAKAPRKAKTQDPPAVAVDAEPAANETTVEAPPATVEPKPQTQTPPPKAEPVKAETASVTESDVKAAVGKLATNSAAGGAPKAREILAKYSASNISTLKPENYAKAHADIMAVLKIAEDAAAVAS